MIKDKVIEILSERGVELSDIAEIVYQLQLPYHPDLKRPDCLESVERVVEKREVQNAILTGVALDMLAEQNLLPEPLLTIIRNDDPLYGVDEILALAITNVYGSVGLTSFGYLDKMKMGILGTLNSKKDDEVAPKIHTFLDDVVAGIAAAAAARIAHRRAAVV